MCIAKAQNFLVSSMRTIQLLEKSNPRYLPEASFDKLPSGDAFKIGRQDSSSNSDNDTLSSPSLDVKLDEQINPNKVNTFSLETFSTMKTTKLLMVIKCE